MIKVDKRGAVFVLYQSGVSIRGIARQLKMDRSTVREIIQKEGNLPLMRRSSQIVLDNELIGQLFRECDGYIQRIHERLTEEHQIKIAYSTLSARIRDLQLDPAKNKRCGQVPDVAGEEMQHDTSPYTILIGNQKLKLIASLIYLRYSKLKYLKFYPSFCRFQMKCFIHEALIYWQYCAPRCVIDNTNLAVLHGTGPDAVFVPEMVAFAEQFGFKWFAHKKGHSNRKAGNERSFWTTETNFLKGRTFSSIEDLNRQAFEWATGRNAHRPLAKSGLIPIELFETEKSFLKKLPAFTPAPYSQHQRDVDQYGFIQLHANHYWIPGASLEKVLVLEYAEFIKIFRKNRLLIDYRLPPFGTKNKKIKPEGIPELPYEPKQRSKPTQEEEINLKNKYPDIVAYLSFIDRQKISPVRRNQLIRRLHSMSQMVSEHFFIQTLIRATHYRVTNIEQLERIASQLVSVAAYEIPIIDSDSDYGDLEEREAYQEGKITWTSDLSGYDRLLKNTEEEE